MFKSKIRPNAYVLVGLPGVGKSTWIQGQGFDLEKTVILGTDNYIENYAAQFGKTYDEVFEEAYPNALKVFNAERFSALVQKKDIVIDRTNLTPKARRSTLNIVESKEYRRVAVVFIPPEKEELERRLKSRPGKTVPDEIFKQMVEMYVQPEYKEQFDEIVLVHQDGTMEKLPKETGFANRRKHYNAQDFESNQK